MNALFAPFSVGRYALKHRVVMAPLTRMRTDTGNVPGDLMVEYYKQRATPGGLLISDATAVSPLGIAYVGAPGIYTEAQVFGWRRVTDAVHENGGRIFLQLWHAGRQAHPANTGGVTPIAPSAIQAFEHAAILNENGDVIEAAQVMPRALATAEIASVIETFRNGAELAKRAGFDGVELHAANGYLPDQFLQDGSNHRTDSYGGSLENRARFLFEVVDAINTVWDADQIAVRLSPGSSYGTMADSDARGTFIYVTARLNGYGLAYLHVVEPRVRGNDDVTASAGALSAAQLRRVYKGPIIAAGGFTADSASHIINEGSADLVAFGRLFISNPDLPERLRVGAPLSHYDRSTFYGGDAKGYIDYPSYSATEAA
ncbi:alkene reductase [Robbsia andropogonis]|uniref:alkene reductase n=2 Tax=Robbsia andropogonis TaxID=28092 RepID=UPI002A6B47FE|nr:alkene reductase [Robbsia andropogonis]